jgi:hypothetical protein
MRLISPFLRKLRRPHIWRRIFNERLTEPLHVNAASVFVAILGTLRGRIAHDLIIRPHNAYSILQAADWAKSQGVRVISLVEFGVAAGAGLMNMAHIAAKVTRATGIEFKIYGFDTGRGMPPPVDFRDHPDLYHTGDFPMDERALRAALPNNVTLLIGDVAQTVPEFLKQVSSSAPIGYVVFDLDYYSSTQVALAVLKDPDPSKYLPLTITFFDDMHHPRHNQWCGEFLAIEDFNSSNPTRKIGQDAFLADRRIYRRSEWIKQMFFLHVLDSPLRRTSDLSTRQVLENPYLTRMTDVKAAKKADA